MGNLTSNILEEQQLGEFKKISSNADVDVELPAPPESRTLTDKKGFVIFGILMLVLFPFLIYTLVKSDIRRLGHGVDSCGNLCGVTNAKISGINCSGQDYSNQPYEKILISENRQICTSECPFTHVQKGKKCIDEDDIFGNNTIYTAEVWQYTLNSWWKFIIDIVITIVLSIGMLVLFRYIPGVIVWGVSVFSLIVAVAVTSFFWFNFKQDNNQGWLSLALISTVFTIIIFILFVVMFKRIQLIIQLYKETTKAICNARNNISSTNHTNHPSTRFDVDDRDVSMDGNCTRAQKRPTEYISISSKWRDAVCNGVQHHRHNLGVAVFRGVSIHDAGRKRRSVVFQKEPGEFSNRG
jgi:hypothetical protein